MAKLKNDPFSEFARYLHSRRPSEDPEEIEDLEYEEYDEDDEESERYDPSEYDPAAYRHSNSADSKCTTCALRNMCDIFAEMCLMNDKGMIMIMLNCKYYEKEKPSHNTTFDGMV
jgi:hypothetical protein